MALIKKIKNYLFQLQNSSIKYKKMKFGKIDIKMDSKKYFFVKVLKVNNVYIP